ncbi:MAG: hypothetical protein WC455_26200 [Dehalococcoidia bacterium]
MRRSRLARLLPVLMGGGGESWVTPTDIPAAEAAALKELYELTDGDNWTNHTNWGLTATADDWYGITVLAGKVQIIGLIANNLVGDISTWNMAAFTAIEDIYMRTNASLIGDISGWTFPAAFENIQLYSTGLSGDISTWTFPNTIVNISLYTTSVSGDISGWVLPSALQTFSIHSTLVTGDISGWVLPTTGLNSFQIHNTALSGSIASWVIPAKVDFLYLHDTSLTGVPDLTAAAEIEEIYVINLEYSQAVVDAWLAALYARRLGFTKTPKLFIGGTNAAPSGVYQDATSPTTGKEFEYKLENDPDAEGFPVWVISVTA